MANTDKYARRSILITRSEMKVGERDCLEYFLVIYWSDEYQRLLINDGATTDLNSSRCSNKTTLNTNKT